MRNIIIVSETEQFKKDAKTAIQRFLTNVENSDVSSDAASITAEINSVPTIKVTFAKAGDITSKQDDTLYFLLGNVDSTIKTTLEGLSIITVSVTGPEAIIVLIKQAIDEAQAAAVSQREEAARQEAARQEAARQEAVRQEEERTAQAKAEKVRLADEAKARYQEAVQQKAEAESNLAETTRHIEANDQALEAIEQPLVQARATKLTLEQARQTATQERDIAIAANLLASQQKAQAEAAVVEATRLLEDAEREVKNTTTLLQQAQKALEAAKQVPVVVTAPAVDDKKQALEGALREAAEALDTATKQAKDDAEAVQALKAEQAKVVYLDAKGEQTDVARNEATGADNTPQKKTRAQKRSEEQDLKTVMQKAERSAQQVKDLTVRLEDCQEALVAYKPAPAATETENPAVQTAQAKVAELTEQLERHTARRKEQMEKLAAAQLTATQKNAAVVDLEQQIEALKTQIARKTNELADPQSTIDRYLGLNQEASRLEQQSTTQKAALETATRAEQALKLEAERAQAVAEGREPAPSISATLSAVGRTAEEEARARVNSAAAPSAVAPVVNINDDLQSILARMPNPKTDAKAHKTWLADWAKYRDTNGQSISQTPAYHDMVKGYMLTHIENQLVEKSGEAQTLLEHLMKGAKDTLTHFIKATLRLQLSQAQAKVLNNELATAASEPARRDMLMAAIKKQEAVTKECEHLVQKLTAQVETLRLVDSKDSDSFTLAKKIAALQYCQAILKGKAGLALEANNVDKGAISAAVVNMAKGQLGSSQFGKICEMLENADTNTAICEDVQADFARAVNALAAANLGPKVPVTAQQSADFKAKLTAEFITAAKIGAVSEEQIMATAFASIITSDQQKLAAFTAALDAARQELAKTDSRATPNPRELLDHILSEKDDISAILNNKRGGILAVRTPASIRYLQELRAALDTGKSLEVDSETKTLKLSGLNADLTTHKAPAVKSLGTSQALREVEPLLSSTSQVPVSATLSGSLPNVAVPVAVPTGSNSSAAPVVVQFASSLVPSDASWATKVQAALKDPTVARTLDDLDRNQDPVYQAALKAKLQELFAAGIKKYQHQLSEVDTNDADKLALVGLLNRKIDALDLALQTLVTGKFNPDLAKALAPLSRAISPDGRLFDGHPELEINRLKGVLNEQIAEHERTSEAAIQSLQGNLDNHNRDIKAYHQNELKNAYNAMGTAAEALNGDSSIEASVYTKAYEDLGVAQKAFETCRAHYNSLHTAGVEVAKQLATAKKAQVDMHAALDAHKQALAQLATLQPGADKTATDLLHLMVSNDAASSFHVLSEHSSRGVGATDMRADLDTILNRVVKNVNAFRQGEIKLTASPVQLVALPEAPLAYEMTFPHLSLKTLATVEKVEKAEKAAVAVAAPTDAGKTNWFGRLWAPTPTSTSSTSSTSATTQQVVSTTPSSGNGGGN
jgi:hypothetical protein